MNTKVNKSRVRCYIDWLNFYYSAASPYNFKWIDLQGVLQELLEQVLKNPEIEKIIMFTSTVTEPAAKHQGIYLNALKHHIDHFEQEQGTTRIRKKRGKPISNTECYKLRENAKTPLKLVTIETREEKCTDVNFACRVVVDAYEEAGKTFDIACVVTNDMDIMSALKAKRRLNQRVILISPMTETNEHRISKKLKNLVQEGDHIRSIRKKLLLKHPLPVPVDQYYPPNARGWYVPTDKL